MDGAEALLINTETEACRLGRESRGAVAGACRLLRDCRGQLAELCLASLAALAIVAQQIIGGSAHHAAVATFA